MDNYQLKAGKYLCNSWIENFQILKGKKNKIEILDWLLNKVYRGQQRKEEIDL